MFPSSRAPTGYYPGASGKYGYNSKGGSPFPSIARSKGGHVDLVTAASQATMLRSRDRSKNDKEFIQLEEFDVSLADKAGSFEKDDSFNNAGLHTTQIERGSMHNDDAAVLLPIQSTQGLPPTRALYQNHSRSISPPTPQAITVRKDYSVTVEVTPDQLSSSPPSERDDMRRMSRRESQIALTALPGMGRPSSSRNRHD